MLTLSHIGQIVASAKTQAKTQCLAVTVNIAQAKKTHTGLETDHSLQLTVILALLARGDMMNNKQIAELVYALRVVVDAFEDWSLTDHQQESIATAMAALAMASREVHELANEMENEE